MTSTSTASPSPSAEQAQTRRGTVSDIPFIYSSWLKSYRNSEDTKGITDTVYYAHHHNFIEALLSRPTCVVLIVSPTGDPNTILGYSVTDSSRNGPVIHYVYVKEAWRKMGLMKRLLSDAQVDVAACLFTHRTKVAERLWSKYTEARYCPYMPMDRE